MSAADGGLRKEIQKGLPKPEWRHTPIETGSTHQGVPDSYYLHRPSGDNGWIECKKTDGWAVKLESHQVGWLSVHAAAGVRCSLAVRASGAGSAQGRGDALYLIRAERGGVEALEEHSLKLDARHVLGFWLGPPKSWDWGEITRILRRTDHRE